MYGKRSRYDAIVAGVGGMGSATIYHLARRRWKVLGLDRYSIPHEMGSSHGFTRMIRLAYHEHPSYVPLLRRAYELWRVLEREAGRRLLHITGSLDAGPPTSQVFGGSLESCRLHDLPHQVLTSPELTARFPALRLPPETMAVLQPDGGFLEPEACIVSHAALATTHGASVCQNESIVAWEPAGNGVRVVTDRQKYEAARLVICVGAWAAKLVPELAGLVVPERQVLGWFDPTYPELFASDRLPVFVARVNEGGYYGFPMFGDGGFKIGRYHHLGETVDPDCIDRQSHPADEAVLRTFVERYTAAGPAVTRGLKVCMFANTRDEHFILDHHPGCPGVSIAAGFSGHGFKFCSVVGEVMADLVEHGATTHDITRFRLSRLREL